MDGLDIGPGRESVKYLGAVAATILIYDWLLTLDAEIDHIWSRSWGFVEGLYLFTKYAPFADTTVMILYRDLLSGSNNRLCHITMSFVSVMYVISMTVGEVIILLRTWAIWGRSPVVGLLLVTQAIVVFAMAIIFAVKYADSLLFVSASDSEPIPLQLGGCITAGGSNADLIDWSLFTGMESFYLITMLVHTYPLIKRSWGVDSAWFYQVLFRDGIVYYMVLFTLSAINISIVVTQKGIASTSLATPTRVLHAIFSARIILHIREADGKMDTTDTSMPPMTFAEANSQIDNESIHHSHVHS
ncbi:hypothetical protein BJ138DRAFT_1141486 [Hygrophoropsis aurantiaca]|uniref:Uncharacterized protein n=1 Tax=Hygrophoropsis aurantiaca TaxID=72124 RepID=A0ACB8APV7_9AGAM|nr:hypothetical protein BJ138DRAFT_1141486 [Hygrophoropsis aurantiaca]